MIITFSTYWIFTSLFFTSIILRTVESTTIPGFTRLSSTVQAGNEYSFLMDNISTAIIIFFVLLGVGYICWAYKSKYPAVLGLFALILCPLYFPSPLTASGFAMVTLRIDRFMLLISPFFAFVLGIGFLFLLNTLFEYKYSRKMAIVFGLLLFSFLCFSALTGPNSIDSKDLPSDLNRVHFTEPEMDAFNFIPQYIEYNASISSDRYSSRMFEQPFFNKTKTLNLPSYYGYSSLSSIDPYEFRDGYFILRNQELERKGLGFESNNNYDYAEFLEPRQDIFEKFSNMTFASNKIYDNQKVSILSNLL
jgi:hypothetical protein